MSIAAQVGAWGRRWPKGVIAPASTRGAGLVGAPILAQQFTDLRIVVEIAWGAAPGTDPSAMTWTDVTGDVQYDQKINITVGRIDESATSNPANLAFRLLNLAGAYSKGPQSSNYPNVVRNTPIRVRAILNGVSYTRVLAYAVGFTPGWDITGNYAIVDVVAAGVLRRLGQGQDALASTLTRSIPTLPSLVAYWPCEDGPSATQFSPGITGGYPLYITGAPNPAAFSKFACSNPIPTLQTDVWTGRVSPYTGTGSNQVRFLWYAVSGTIPDKTRIMSIATTGSICRLDVLYGVGGGLYVYGYASNATSSTPVFQDGPFGVLVDNSLQRVSVQWQPSGSDTQFQVSTYIVEFPAGGYNNFTASGQAITGITGIMINPDGGATGASIGQIYVQDTYDDLFVLFRQVNAFAAETPTQRLARLCAEQGEQVTITGSSLGTMGPQIPDTFLNLLRACEAVDVGLLYDGPNPGLTYVYREFKENQLAAITLDASQGDIANPVPPVDDDQRTLNQYQASRTNGGTYTYAQTTGTQSVAGIGDYSNSGTFNCQYDSHLPDLAAWQVHLGTVDDYRWPLLYLKFEQAPRVLAAWLATPPASRLDVVNLSAVRSQVDPKPLSLLLEGYNEIIDQFTWDVVANCSPYGPWSVGVFAADVGDASANLLRFETDGSSVTADAAPGSLILSVATPSGPLWTTNGDDFPFSVQIGGTQIVVENIIGASSLQAFTVNGIPYHIPAGSAVTLWAAPVLAI